MPIAKCKNRLTLALMVGFVLLLVGLPYPSQAEVCEFLGLVVTHAEFASSEGAWWQKQPKTKPLQEQEETVTLKAPLVTLGVRVTDRKGRDVPALKAEDFSVYENGVRQRIAFFSAEAQPVSLGILLDKSGSMREGEKIELAKTAALSLVKASHPGNEFLYIPFDHEVRVAAEFTTERERIEAAISKTFCEGGGTSLYDAIITGLDRLGKATHPRQVLVVVTDGGDQHSRSTLDQVIERLQASQAQLYLIAYFSKQEAEVYSRSGKTLTLINGQEVDNPHFVFKRLTEESGAEYFFPKSDEELRQAVEAISSDLRYQYTLAYYPPHPSKGSTYRRIEVKVNQSGVKIRTRRGYRLSEEVEEESPAAEAKAGSEARVQPSEARASKYEAKVERKDGRLIYREDFADPASGWPNTSLSFYERGRYRLKNPQAQVTMVTNGPAFEDFRASVTVEVSSSQVRYVDVSGMTVSSSPGAGLVFRASQSGYYAFLIAVLGFSRGHFNLTKQVGNQTVEIIRWTPNPSITWRNKLSVTCQGNRIELYINGRPVGSITDESFKEGVIGLLLTEKGHAVFDDLIVEEIQRSHEEHTHRLEGAREGIEDQSENL